MIRVRLDISYDGQAFKGFAENLGVTTVAGVLRPKLEKVYSQPITLTCAGRTDSGVHARQQVVSFAVRGKRVEPIRLRNSLNSLLAPSVVTNSVSIVDTQFDARYAAMWRQYRYLILNSEVPDPLLAPTTWWVEKPLNMDAMQEASLELIGLHDFTSFCKRPKDIPNATLVRRLLQAEWTVEPELHGRHELLRFEIAGSAFCHQMVRSIVGTLVDVGRGRWTAAQVGQILAAQDRSLSSNVAPPHALSLWNIGYPGDETPVWLPRREN